MKKKPSLTKKKIKNSAINLFNEGDTLSITTNHIASKAGISSGNLYYHYKNKEDILVDIYLDMSEKFESFESFDTVLTSENPLKSLYEMYDLYGDLFWEYRFLMRDSVVLMRLNPKLKEMFLKKQTTRISQIESLINYFIFKEIFIDIAKQEISLRAKLNWFISAYWQTFVSNGEEINKESIKEIKDIVFTINIYPFLTNKGKLLVKDFKKE
jgi:AcrR family transcriptional regulator